MVPALPLVPGVLSGSPVGCCRLQVEREIRLHSCLQHDSIISLYAAFEDDQHVYLAQEFAAGRQTHTDVSLRL